MVSLITTIHSTIVLSCMILDTTVDTTVDTGVTIGVITTRTRIIMVLIIMARGDTILITGKRAVFLMEEGKGKAITHRTGTGTYRFLHPRDGAAM